MTFVLAIALGAWGAAIVSADPLRGEFLKFQQLPLDGTVVADRPWFGHDEVSTAHGTHSMVNADGTLIPGSYSFGQFMADDFADKFDTPVVHIRWWGSYRGNVGEPTATAGGGVQRFLVSWETDVPAGQGGTNFSHPGVPLQNEVLRKVPAGGALLPGSGTFTETFVSPGGAPLGEHLWKYNAELACPFDEKADTVYWLKIVALNDPAKDGTFFDWGWHDRDYTVMDPLASSPPVVVPGEHSPGGVFDGFDPVTGAPRPLRRVWHFQDDAVAGNIFGIVDAGGCTNVRFQLQSEMLPQRYIDLVDGPGPVVLPGPVPITVPGIGSFSKDLAFELYSIPEPGTVGLAGLGLTGLAAFGWRRRKMK